MSRTTIHEPIGQRMAIDVLLPAVVKQHLDRGSLPAARASNQDPSGEENRLRKALPSSAEQNHHTGTPAIPPIISEFLNKVAAEHGVEPPSPQHLRSAFVRAQDYQPKPLVVIHKPDPAEEEFIEPAPFIPQTDPSPAPAAQDVNTLPESVRREALDYGRMLNALNHYSQRVQHDK